MSGEGDVKEFPDVSSKLSAPKKLSAFEKERQAAEEKRRRAEAETAAALKEFEHTFGQNGNDRDDAYDGFPGFRSRAPTGPRPPGGQTGRYGGPFAAPRSGPGSLGSMPAMQPPSLKRKRALDEMREAEDARREHTGLMGDYRGRGTRHEEKHSDPPEDETEDVPPRPTVQLSSLPPWTTAEDIKSILRDYLQLYSVQFQPPSGPCTAGRRTLTAIATLSAETPVSQIDTAVSSLKDKYIGNGFRLSISRHLSSAALLPVISTTSNLTSSEPFGAQKPARDQPGKYNMHSAPPPSEFAPPDSYDMPVRSAIPQNATVSVQLPLEISTVRAVHTVVDRLLSEPDPARALQIEAMLMALPEVQKDERFSFLYDSRSTAGVYYRFMLWNDDDSYDSVQARKRFARGPERVHDDVVIGWLPPHEAVLFADISKLGQVVDHPSYESSDESSDDGEGERRFNHSRREGEGPVDVEKKHLTPLLVAKFAWMLSRMPSSHSKLRKGDVAAVTFFAINHAGAGAEEIVDMLVLNVEKSYTTTRCARFDNEDATQDEYDVYEPDEELPAIRSTPIPDDMPKPEKKDSEDPSQARLVALYLINDVLQNSSTAGVRNAWKYRQLFENAFKRHKTFEHLGQLEKILGWGRIKAEQWRNKIRVLFEIWEHGSVFASDVFEALKKSFFDQPVPEAEVENGEGNKTREENWMGRFKRIEGTTSPAKSVSPAPQLGLEPLPSGSITCQPTELDGIALGDLDGTIADDIDGAPIDDLDGAFLDDLDEPSVVEDTDMPDPTTVEPPHIPTPPRQDRTQTGFSFPSTTLPSKSATNPPEPRRRKLAEDMFADSDED